MQFDQVRERIILILTSLLVTAPLLQVYRPAGNGLDVYDHPVGRDFINVWSGPQVAFGD